MHLKNNTLQRIVLTPGEPAGIGPDITLAIATETWHADLIAIADPKLLRDRAQQLHLPIEIIECDLNTELSLHKPNTLKVYPIALNAEVIPGQLNTNNASYVINTIRTAADFCQTHFADALVTGPVHKGILNAAGIHFSGHTEFLAQLAGVNDTVMMFIVDQFKVALATTHIPLKLVSDNITRSRLENILTILHDDLKKRFNLVNPRIAVAGLNPHAGENGYLGREEIDVIEPVLAKMRENNFVLLGPMPADTLFTEHELQRFDAVLAMYHDQALPLIKYIGFDRAINMTLGLPYVRTSVDHGTALTVAGTGHANAGSLRAALQLAIQLTAI